MGEKTGEKTQALAFAAIVFASLVAGAFFANASNFLHTDLFALTNFDAWLAFLANPNFILFAIVFPIPYGLISALTHFKERKFVYMAALAGAVPAMVVSVVMAGIGFAPMLLALFVVIGFVALIETSYVKKEELKFLVSFRTAAGASKAAFLLLAIGLLIVSGTLAYNENDRNVERLGKTIMSMAFSQQAGSSGMAELGADLLVNSQKQALSAITSLPQYEKLKTKQDPDVQIFVASMGQIQDGLESGEIKAKVVQELQKKESELKQPITFDMIRKQSPLVEAIASYYWAIAAFATVTLFMFASNLVLSNIAGVYAAFIKSVLGALKNGATLKAEQADK
ncbi:MAG TPA: hypothetical protein HA254_05680 [Candidatus Diapherotrites archaeon]|uniref:Uncharacterized protein n=1 Tax=Candidatus Iainarchaeum sp. TaxID=3101447 RepID=A0A7J4J249_9ARCH|nr:hypothetical protein [Candidatus Diapherotrites archaeon]